MRSQVFIVTEGVREAYRQSKEARAFHELVAEVAGKLPTKLALTWDDRISFILTEKFEIKRLAFLDILKEESDNQAENEDERFDLDFTLMTGEIAHLLDDLIAALGGEMEKTES